MGSIAFSNTILLVGAMLVLIGVFSSLVAQRFGAPLLLVFLVIGMLAGQDGPLGLEFNDYQLTYLVGSLALAVILFDGGLRTRISSFRGALSPAVTLSTLGVVLTASFVGVAAWLLLPLSPIEALLLGAIVASTDAAAVFFLLRTGGMQLRPRVNATLEIESGTNDPVAVFLTLVLAGVLMQPEPTIGWEVLGMLLQQGVIGAVLGIGGGLLGAWLLNRLELASGLHPLFVIAGAVFVFALAAVLGGSGFLAAYLAGLTLGNRQARAIPSIVSFHDTATWLAQIVMFLALGLLVVPSELITFLPKAVGIALVLMLVARPLAVTLCLLPFGFTRRETLFVSWVGLRGAVSIFLAAIPMLSGLDNADLYFNVAFFVVLISLMLQGWTIRPAARQLGMVVPRASAPVRRVEVDLPGQLEYELVGYPIHADSPVLARRRLPPWVRQIMVVRDGTIISPEEAGELRPEDYLYLLAPPARVDRLDQVFASPAEQPSRYARPVGYPGNTPAAEVAESWHLRLPEEEAELTLSELVEARSGEPARIGLTAQLDASWLVVQEVADGVAQRVDLLFHDPDRDLRQRLLRNRWLGRPARALRRWMDAS